MNIVKKITILNQAAFESINASDNNKIIGRFTKAGLQILKGNFGFMFWKEGKSKTYQLAYKSPNTPFQPNLPRKTGYNALVGKTKQPYISVVRKEKDPKYDLTPYMKSIVIIPIYYKTRTFGNLVLCFKYKRNFSKEEYALCTALGNAAAQAIALNQMHTNLEDLVNKRTKQLKKSNKKLERDNAEDEALLANLGEGIIATDTEGIVILVNPQAEEILKIDKDKMVGKNFYDIVPFFEESGELVAFNDRPLHQTLTKGKKVKTGNYYIVRKQGDKIPIYITVTPILLKGQLIGAIQVIQDITKEKVVDKAKSELISLASHQLRTPLSAINWYAEALIKEELGPVNSKQKKYLQEIFNANRKMIELVYDFLNVSRIELGTFTLQLSTFSPKEMAQGVLRELQPHISKKRLKIGQSYEPARQYIQADKKVIRLILQNLLSNAVKYTPPGGCVKLKIALVTQSTKQRLVIDIQDTGYGIPKHQHQKVFTKLFRGDNVMQLQTEGTGLGLYIVKSFVDLCKGKIQFQSNVNKGTRFYLELPVLQAPSEQN
jgi:PAS domain S-box-containing protein